MPHRRRPIRITIVLSPIDHRAYARAARTLAKIMGNQAPDVGALVQAQLSGRDPTGVADEYLDSIRWPMAKGRVVSMQLSRPKPRQVVSPTTTSKQPQATEAAHY